MEYTYQIAAGSPGTPAEALRRAFGLTGAGDVIIGWAVDGVGYAEVIELTHSVNKKCWLWLPVFADQPDWLEPDASIDCDGRPQQGLLDVDGVFRFACPTSKRNVGMAYQMYLRDFAGYNFDGVFLDRVRHSSFSGGYSNAFGCFCDKCKAVYAGYGVELDKIAAIIKKEPSRMLPDGLKNEAGTYTFADEAVDRFYSAKAALYTGAVLELAAMFEARGLQVAFDVFAPSLAYLVGQDLPALAARSAFIKPMFYRITGAPAGLPYEYKWFGQDALLKRLWDTPDLLSASLMERQLKNLPRNTRPGFEINVVPGVCESGGGYVRETAALIERSGLDNAVLSWNLLSASGENLQALSNPRHAVHRYRED
jgi:hypothetical protein